MSVAVVTMPAILSTVTRATGFVVVSLLRPTVERYFRGDLCYAAYTKFFKVLGEFFSPTSFPLRLKQLSNQWPTFVRCEQVTTTAEGVDVTTIMNSYGLASLRFSRRPVSHSSIFVHVTHCYHSSVECEVIICFVRRCILFAGIHP